MPVYIARKLNTAFNEGWGLWRNAENNFFTFTFEYSRRNLASRQNRTIMKKMQSCNVLSMIPRYAQNSKLASMSLIGNFDIWEEFSMFVIEG